MAASIDHDHIKWNEQRVWAAISPSDAEKVLQIPLSARPRENKIRWPLTKDGGVSFKSVYHRLRERSREANNRSQVGAGWSVIWKAKVWPKVKVFMWKLKSNALAIHTNLERKRVPTPPLCLACKEVENREHLVKGYSWTN